MLMTRHLVSARTSRNSFNDLLFASDKQTQGDEIPTAPGRPPNDALLVLLPLLIVLSTFLFIVLLFLVCILLIRRRRGIVLRENDGPVDMSREELIDGDAGLDLIESRWLESVSDDVHRTYIRARDYQLQFPPNSLPTDITLSQFLSIQEKGVSAWCFEPDYETVNSLLVHARTEITFLPDPASSSCVQSNLPLPKLNEVYYWEVKMFDLPESTTVAVGLATKPYPPFRLPGSNRYSVAYLSNGDKSHNYPFHASSFGPALHEGDVLGVGYRPRTGTVFFTRNGRKTEDAYVGLTRWNLFPTVGADGPCSVHVNLGQAGFVFIEANVKKWGLAPSVGTLAPPPAYGSERGSILLDVGGNVRLSGERPVLHAIPSASSPASRRRSHRAHRPRQPPPTVLPLATSPLRTDASAEPAPLTPPPPITPIDEESEDEVLSAPSTSRRYISPTDLPFHNPPNTNLPTTPPVEETSVEDCASVSSSSSSSSSSGSEQPSLSGREHASGPSNAPRIRRSMFAPLVEGLSHAGPPTSRHQVLMELPPESPDTPDLPTPGRLDIRMHALIPSSSSRRAGADPVSLEDEHGAGERTPVASVDPPAYSPLDAYTYSEGVHIDLPAEVIAAALEGGGIPAANLSPSRSERHRSGRRGAR